MYHKCRKGSSVSGALHVTVKVQRLSYVMPIFTVLVGPCHHGMARPQVADRGTASDKEGSCE